MALVLFNKPYGVICQFSGGGERATLADFIRIPAVYPAGRLDIDSEGLLLLTDDGALQHRIADPRGKMPKSYWVQVEGDISQAALHALEKGVDLGDFVTARAQARKIGEPEGLWPRDPPIRYRAAIPTSWLELTITEGKNRQVRRMTASVGFPTLRLIRHRIGPYALTGLAPGEWRKATAPPAPEDRPAARTPHPARANRPQVNKTGRFGARAGNPPKKPPGSRPGAPKWRGKGS